ncbi:uncharacterized protein LOC113354407 [Papaver somniferum]|uniref:uncharacterized protein LOC113354407 n=1 Tax=Papaver somniferum TaxID=3469 RepID=UPI000E6F9B3E|nr:uncharacterized protein LOC113354407 [Papaver somniferum]
MPMNYVNCSRCSDPDESNMHALVLCPFASHVWSLACFFANTNAFIDKTFIYWLKFWLINPASKIPDDKHSFFVTIQWSLWTCRNNLVFRNLQENHLYVINRSRVMLLTVRKKPQNSPTQTISYNDIWMPPTFGWIKCNIDGAFDDTTLVNGAGYVMRDFSSTTTFCASIIFEVTSAEKTEARAI